MPLNPSKSLRFESWKHLLRWLPEATESQLMTVFVWSGDYSKVPAGDARRLAEVRKAAFEELVSRTGERLKRFLTQRCDCRDPYLADDVVQQVLIKVYMRAEQFDPQRSFWGWLYRVARNDYIDTLRRIRPGDIGVGQAGQTDDEADQWLETTAIAPDSGAADAERRQQLADAIARLPRLQQSILRLKQEGVKGKEIAQRLGISQAYVSQLYHEALEIVRELVAS